MVDLEVRCFLLLSHVGKVDAGLLVASLLLLGLDLEVLERLGHDLGLLLDQVVEYLVFVDVVWVLSEPLFDARGPAESTKAFQY